MKHRFSVLGAGGMQGLAIAYDLACHAGAESIFLMDRDEETAYEAADRLRLLIGGRCHVSAHVGDSSDVEMLKKFFREHEIGVCVNSLPYFLTPQTNQAAVEAGVSVCDLGGNTDLVVKMLRELDGPAKERGVVAVPDCGLAPGLAQLMAAHIANTYPQVDSVSIYCGGIPVSRGSLPLGFSPRFGIPGLLNEYAGDANVIWNGRVSTVPTLDQIRDIDFCPREESVYIPMEAAATHGGLSTSPWTLASKLKHLEYVTLRHPGHFQYFDRLKREGRFNTEKTDSESVSPRDVLEAELAKMYESDDRESYGYMIVFAAIGRCSSRASDGVDVTRLGVLNDGDVVQFFLDDYGDAQTGLDAMQRGTGFNAGIVAKMIADGNIKPGARKLETVNTDIYLQELKIRFPHLKIIEQAAQEAISA